MTTRINLPFITAIALATIGAAVSLYGLVMMFGAAFLPIGVGLEAGKLTAAAALHRSWATLSWRVRYTLSAIVVVLMTLTSGGIYGFVLTGYLAHLAEITAPVAEKITIADGAISQQAEKVSDLDRQIASIDSTPVLEITSSAKPRTAAQIQAAAKAQEQANKARIEEDQRRQAKRDGLVAKRDVEAGELARLRNVRAEIGTEQKAAEAEVGPMKLVADILGVDPGKVVAAAVASIYDALCVLLLIAAGHKPVAPVIEQVAPVVTRKRSRSEAARAGWQTRRANKLAAAYKRGPVAVK